MFKTVKVGQAGVCDSAEARNKIDVRTQLYNRYDVSETFTICTCRPLQN